MSYSFALDDSSLPEVPPYGPPALPDNVTHLPVILADLRRSTRDEWLSLRKIGGSDAAAVMNESPYGNAFSLHAEKTNRVGPRAESEAMELGSLLEPMVATLFSRRTDLEVQKCHHLYAHPQYPWMTATPDFYTLRNGRIHALVQIKTTSEYNAEQWSDGPPRHVYLQVQHEMAVTGVRECWAVCLIGGNKLVYHHVPLDEECVDALIVAESLFWANVESGTPPAITAEDKETLTALYPMSSERVVQLPPDAESFVIRYRQANAAIADAERERDLCANCLKAMLGDAAEGYAGDTKVTWRTYHKAAFTVPAKTSRGFRIAAAKRGAK